MKRKRNLEVRSRISRRPEAVPLEGPLTWAVRISNPNATTIHVATGIKQIHAAPDGRSLRISTERPVFDEDVSFAFFNLETVPVQPGESHEAEFGLELPLRLATLTGFPPRAEVVLWTPAPAFTLVTEFAFGDRPYQAPADPRRLAESLHEWTHVLRAPAMRLRRSVEREG